jgi:hypothetical protein
MHEGKIEKPRMQVVNGEARRLWSDADIVKVLDYKRKHYREGCGHRKPVEQRMSTSGGIFEVFVRNPKRLYDACMLGPETYAALTNCDAFLTPENRLRLSQLSARFREIASSQLTRSLEEIA